MDETTKSNFIQAVNYIYDNIDQSITLETIAQHSHMSVSTLKRVFEELTNQSPGAFLRRMRMEYAFVSLQSKKQSVLETALSAGFEDHSAFSRRFKETFGYSPTKARQKLNIVSELEHVVLEEPDIVEIESIKMQSVTKQGLYFECAPAAWNELAQILTSKELDEEFSGLFIGIGHDNPHDGEVTEDQMRFTAGVCFSESELGLQTTTIASGRYARFRYVGKIMNLGVAYHYIFGKWSDESGFQVSKVTPAFMSFDGFPKVEKEQHVTIHVPLE